MTVADHGRRSASGRGDEGRRIELGHGGGGQLTRELIREVFARHLANPILDPLDDAGLLPDPGGRLAMTTDGFVVSPPEFAGGDIGSLAVHGTVNDLAVSGAVPQHLTLGAILEEGVEWELVDRIACSAGRAAREAGVTVVSGDTEVVERDKGDGIYLTTAGVGVLREGYPPDEGPRPGDALLVSGPVGDHGAVILAARSGLEPGTGLRSDGAAVTPLVDALFNAGVMPRWMRDPTRAGLAGVLCDLAEDRSLGVQLDEGAIPVRPAVATVCEITGVDPLYLACEGRVVAVVPADDAGRALEVWRGTAPGRDAALLGSLDEARSGQVVLRTRFGGARILLRPTAELLPRIC